MISTSCFDGSGTTGHAPGGGSRYVNPRIGFYKFNDYRSRMLQPARSFVHKERRAESVKSRGLKPAARVRRLSGRISVRVHRSGGCLGCLLAVVVLFVGGRASGAEWTELGPAPIANGPFAGRITAVVASPTIHEKFYIAAAAGGIWRTENNGSTWTALAQDMPTLVIGALAMDPDNEDILYAGSGEANFANHSYYGLGVYKTVDGGDSWTVLATDTFAGRTFSRILVSHADGDVLFASIMPAGGFPAINAAKGHPLAEGPVGVFRSIDGGVSWTHLTNGLPAEPASDVWLDPIDATVVYAAIGDIFGIPENGIYKSQDGGDSWVKLAGGLPTTDVGRISLAIAPSDPNRIYTIITQVSDEFGGGASLRGVYRSDDAGATWTHKPSANFQATYGWYLSTAIVHPLNPDTVFVGGVTLLRSTTGGNSWTFVTPQHVDMHGLAWDKHFHLLAADDGGLHKSTNNGSSWTALNTGLGTIQIYPGLSLSETNENFILAGMQDNGTNRRIIDSIVWSHSLGGDGGYTAVNPFNPSMLFAEFQGSGNLFRSTDGGATFNSSGSGISGSDRNCFLPPMTYFPDSSTNLLYGTHRIYRSTNNGSSWTPITGDLTSGAPFAIRAIAIAPSNSQTVYIATNGGRIQVSTDGGFTWDLKLTDVPGWPRVTRELAIDPLDDSVAYLGIGNFGVDKVLRTTDRGDTWTSVTGDLPDVPVICVAVHHVGYRRTVFAGTDAGVYYSINDSGTWTELGNLPHTPVFR